LGLCYLLSRNRKRVDWRLVFGGILLQITLAVAILQLPFVYRLFQWIADRFVDLLNFTEAGASFVFGSWPDEVWIQTMDYSASSPELIPFQVGYIFAFKVLPTIIFFSAFSAILFYFGILQKIIYLFALMMSKVMSISGAESTAAAANVFIGQTEAPLVVKPYLEKMSESEIMCLMTGGMATIAGGVFALFVALLGPDFAIPTIAGGVFALFVALLGPDFAIHFLTASIISAPAAIVAAKILIPEDEPEGTKRALEVPKERLGNNVLDAITLGTTDGLRLAVNVGAMLLVFLALIALVNATLMATGGWIGINETIASSTDGRFDGLSLEYVLGLAFAPLAWLLGVPSDDILLVGQLLGKKISINEVVAYVDFRDILAADDGALSPKSIIIATYALCGFSNFASIGIQIGGISAIAPGQRKTLTKLAMRALVGGAVASFITATIAGVIV